MTIAPELQFCLLTEPLIRYRRASDGKEDRLCQLA